MKNLEHITDIFNINRHYFYSFLELSSSFLKMKIQKKIHFYVPLLDTPLSNTSVINFLLLILFIFCFSDVIYRLFHDRQTDKDGINNMKGVFTVVAQKESNVYTHILVDIRNQTELYQL